MPKKLFTVNLSLQAEDFLFALPDAFYEKAIHSLLLLRTTPFLGRAYNPEFDSAEPPEGCRRLMVASTSIELFYTVNENDYSVNVFYIDDARMNPLTRF